MSDIPAIIDFYNLKPDESDFHDKILLIKLLALLSDSVPEQINEIIDSPSAWRLDDRARIKMSYSREFWYCYATIEDKDDPKNRFNWKFKIGLRDIHEISYLEIKERKAELLKKIQIKEKCTNDEINELSGYMDEFIAEVESGL